MRERERGRRVEMEEFFRYERERDRERGRRVVVVMEEFDRLLGISSGICYIVMDVYSLL